ncbi:hypothetical protein GWJ21_16635 [Bacillus coagulans]|uniref:hypothetical protein n=1 Tax=Heyndrickxia coagulans TaxID=1398 RepID=UPI001376DD02|nr:hypothetical protein [Heyndrickxia coagulans]NCG69413.1 hypothetical protein [Heyndrickxia coagulans]
MLKKFTIHDFLVLRGPFESGRQGPGSIGVAILLGIILQILMLAVEHHFVKLTYYPNATVIFKFHLWCSIILIILSLGFVTPSVSMSKQKIQYFVLVVIYQNLSSVSLLIILIFLLGTYDDISLKLLRDLTKILLLCGAVVFLVTSIRFYLLLSKGAFRKGSTRDLLRGKLEKSITAYLPILIVSGTGISLIINALSKSVTRLDLDTIVIVLLGILIINTMLFILPEQLVILYCKFRFKSFNFDQSGKLYSVFKDTKGKKKNNRKKTARI